MPAAAPMPQMSRHSGTSTTRRGPKLVSAAAWCFTCCMSQRACQHAMPSKPGNSRFRDFQLHCVLKLGFGSGPNHVPWNGSHWKMQLRCTAPEQACKQATRVLGRVSSCHCRAQQQMATTTLTAYGKAAADGQIRAAHARQMAKQLPGSEYCAEA